MDPALIEAFGGDDFERGMAAVPGEQFQPAQLSLARFLFRFEPDRSNLYRELAKRIRRARESGQPWDGAFVTLNYDRLLSKSLVTKKLQTYLVEPVEDAYEICAPHGLCNLISASSSPDFPAPIIKLCDPTAWMGNKNPNLEHSRIDDWTEFDRHLKSGWAPIMSFFEPEKRSSSEPGWLAARRQRFTTLVEEASRIAVVGVRVHTIDEHIWNPLTKTPAAIFYCSPCTLEFVTLSKHHHRNDPPPLRGTFEEIFEEMLNFVTLA